MTDPELTAHLAKVGVPELYQTWRMKDFTCNVPPINESGLFITGPNGTGKTSLAAAILADRLPGLMKWGRVWNISEGVYRELHRHLPRQFNPDSPYDAKTLRFIDAAFVTVTTHLRELKETFQKDAKTSEGQIINGLIAHRLLVLDDIGIERRTDWQMETLFTLICDRINECRPTIVTTNRSLKEIDVYDPGLASRLSGMTQLKLGGKDRRQKRQ